MDIIAKARKLESTLARTFDRAAQQWSKSGPRGPLEVLHAILEAVDARIEPAGRGRRVFPFNRVRVLVAAPSRDARARLSSVLDGDPSLQTRIAAHLRKAGCDAAGPSVRIAYVPHAEESWLAPEYHIEFANGTPVDVPAPDPVRMQAISLTVTLGTAAEPAYALAQDRINLGRGTEVFTDEGDATNNTVSRRHAHVDYDVRARDFRITDDRSAHGTSIVRNGVAIPVHPGSRGVRLQSGDEIVLGEARLKVETT
jgi:hypothetical protein